VNRIQPTIASLLIDRAEKRPGAPFGTVEEAWSLGDAVAHAAGLAQVLADLGVRPGRRVALVGRTSTAYLVAWAGLQLAGVETALVNPDYPASLLAEMLKNLVPDVVAWSGIAPYRSVDAAAMHIDLTQLTAGNIRVDDGSELHCNPAGTEGVAGLSRRPDQIAGYMHTSGTSGVPKFCAQSQEYFLRLGRFVADALCLSARDIVFAPLPMFHINPLGYGVLGGLTGYAGVLGASRFSASGFWSAVRQSAATIAVLHAPPVEILKRAVTPESASGHGLRAIFWADADFLERFGIPLALSGYGSTEVGGLSHVWKWRIGERCDVPEGMSRYAGAARPDVEWRVSDADEILIRGRRPGVLFSGYVRGGNVVSPLDQEGWFHTGDLGRIDDDGNLVFIERRTESIRVKGEFVPIGFVEEKFASIPGVDDVTLWRTPSDLVDDEVVLYVVAAVLPIERIVEVAAELPSFMRPALLRHVAHLPRDPGVGKVQRRLLADLVCVEERRL